MQALPVGQTEAGEALGLTYLQRMRLIILPQAFRLSMPATINQFVITFKETSLVVIVGLFDLMASTRTAYQSGDWLPYHKEAYMFVAAIFFIGAFSLSRYGAYLEARMDKGER
jgi:general L-amino acid transport system permease protein